MSCKNFAELRNALDDIVTKILIFQFSGDFVVSRKEIDVDLVKGMLSWYSNVKLLRIYSVPGLHS